MTTYTIFLFASQYNPAEYLYIAHV